MNLKALSEKHGIPTGKELREVLMEQGFGDYMICALAFQKAVMEKLKPREGEYEYRTRMFLTYICNEQTPPSDDLPPQSAIVVCESQAHPDTIPVIKAILCLPTSN